MQDTPTGGNVHHALAGADARFLRVGDLPRGVSPSFPQFALSTFQTTFDRTLQDSRKGRMGAHFAFQTKGTSSRVTMKGIGRANIALSSGGRL